MARFALHTCFLSILSSTVFATPDFGIGLNLNLDYAQVIVSCALYIWLTCFRTAAVYHFENGSSAGIAKIEGWDEYKTIMRAQEWILPNYDTDNKTAVVDKFANETASHWSVCDHLPHWLCRTKPDPQTEALLRMIQALQAAAASYTGGKVEYAQVVFPAKPPESLRRSVEAAFSQLPLKRGSWAGRPAGHLVYGTIHDGDPAYVPGPDGPFDQCLSRLVLAVDYSHAALTLNLFSDECGLYGALRTAHYTHLGKSSWDARNRELMVAAVKDTARVPVDSPFEDGVVLRRLTELVVLGEDGRDESLMGVLKEALGETAMTIEGMRLSSTLLDPVFAGAIAAARNSWTFMDEVEEAKVELR